jgi:hypothetical protein
MTLFHRNPERIAHLKTSLTTNLPAELEKYRPTYEARGFSAALNFEDFCATLSAADLQAINLQVLHRLMDSELVGNVLNRMFWGVMTRGESHYPFLTSDRPIIMSNGLKQHDAHILMPISPDRLFLAVNNLETARQIEDWSKRSSLVERVNDLIATQARKYVYGTDDRQLRFVANRLGKQIP